MAQENQKTENRITEMLLDYQHDLGCKRIRDLFKHKTYFEILKKKYDENTHSAFIAWLLEGTDINLPKEDLPIMYFLDLLIEKTQKDKVGHQRISRGLRHSVLTRSVDLEVKKIPSPTEMVIKNLSSIDESKDRVDVYVECSVRINGTKKLLQIFIENKIGSVEGSPKNPPKKASPEYINYCGKHQTERYYSACSDFFHPDTDFAKEFIDTKTNDKKKGKVEQLFVYLTPSDAIGPRDSHFIHITYQELYNRVLSPLLMETSLGTTCYSLIKEYALTLTLPPVNKSDRRQILAIAIGGEEEQLLKEFWTNHKNLIKLAADSKAIEVTAGQYSSEQKADMLLSKFWEMNDDVIMAACYLRLYDKTIRNVDFEEINYILSNLTAGWDQYAFRYNKFTSKHYYKRNLVLEIIRYLLKNKKNFRLDDIQPLKWYDNRSKDPKVYNYLVPTSELDQKYQNNADELNKRFFSDEFEIDGEKYRLSNQWGAGYIFNAFIDKMAEVDVIIKQVAVNGTVKWDDDN